MKSHDPNHGDNTGCDVCFRVFDARNALYQIIGDKWVCDDCAEYSDDLREGDE